MDKAAEAHNTGPFVLFWEYWCKKGALYIVWIHVRWSNLRRSSKAFWTFKSIQVNKWMNKEIWTKTWMNNNAYPPSHKVQITGLKKIPMKTARKNLTLVQRRNLKLTWKVINHWTRQPYFILANLFWNRVLARWMSWLISFAWAY